MEFAQVETKFKELKERYDAGGITEEEFKAQLEGLMIQDEQDRWWIIGYETGQWYYHDGEKWVQSEPPEIAARREQVEALCQEGTAALAAQDWSAAIEKFEAALALEPGHPDAAARLAEAKTRAEEARRLGARRERVAPPAAPARRLWVWVVAGVIGVILLAILIPRIIQQPGPAPAPEEVSFWADRNVIAPGECTILRWEVPGAERAILYGPGFDYLQVPAAGEREVCLEETTRYELKNLDREVIASVVIEVHQ